MSLASKRTARRAVLTIGSLCVALVFSVISCSDSGITEPTNRLSPSPLSASLSASLALDTRIVYLGAPNSQPINFIRARVYDASGTSIGAMDQNLDPSQSSFSFQLPVTLPGAQATVARMTLELANHVGGGEVVQYSGRVASINLSPGDFRQVDIDLYPGPLDNLDVKGVHIVRPIRDEVEGDSTVVKATLDGGTSSSRIFWSSLDPSIATIDNAGLVHAKLPGTARIVAAVGTVADTAPALVTAKPASIEISPSPLTLSKVGDIGTYTATVLDARGAAIPNQHFTWSVADAAIATEVNGGTFQGIRAGQTTVTVHSIETPTLSASAPLIVKALQPGLVRLEITPSDATLHRVGATQTYTVVGRDSAGNVLPTTSISWASGTQSVATITNGVATAVHSGVTTITARQDTLSASATLRVVPNAVALQSVSGNNQQGVAGATAAQPLVVRVVDAQGNGVPGVNVAFSADGTRASVAPTSAMSDTSGLARTQWNFSTAPGTQHATATVDSLSGSPITFAATVTPAGASALVLATPPSDSVASRVVLARQPVVVMRDQFGNTVVRAGVVVTATAGSGVTLTNATATTDTFGRATFTNLTVAGPVGAKTLTFSAASMSSTQADVVVIAGAPASITAVGSATYAGAAGAALGSAPSVKVTDADGNPVAGATVACSIASGGGSIATATATTDANGVASCGAWTLGAVAGTNTLTFSIGTLSTTLTATAAAGSAARYVVTSSGTSVVDGATATITAQLVDANGNAIHTAGVVVDWTSTSGGSFSAASSTTDANGLATIAFTTSKVAGTVHTVRATDASNATGMTGNISVIVGPAVKLQTLLNGEAAAPGTSTGKTGTPSSLSAGSIEAVTINAVDANWNVVASATPTISLSSSDNAAVLPANAALVGGTKAFSVTLKTAGTQTVTAADQASSGALTSGASAAVSVGPGNASASTTTLSVASTIASGASTTVTVTVRDAAGNVLTSATPSDLTATATNGTLGAFSCSNGVCTATYTAPAASGSATIAVKIGGSDVSASPATVTISAGANAKYTVTPAATSVTDGGTTTITAQLVDASNNAVATAGKVITWASTNGGSFSAPTSTTDANGQATVTFTVSKVAGTVHTVTATDAGNLTGSSGNITVTVGAFVKLQLLVPGEAAAAGTATGKTGTPSGATAANAFNVTVNAVDANWNVVSSATDNVAISSTDASAVLPSNAALVAGTKTFAVTLKTAGAQTVTSGDAADNTKTASTSPSITVSIGTASAATSTVAVGSSALSTGGTTTITVTVKDAAGNVIINATPSAFALSASSGTIGTVSCSNGVCTATYTAPASAGTPTITATIGGTNIVNSVVAMTVTAVAPTPAKYTVTSSGSSPVAGSGVTITAQLADASGTAITTAGKVITWSSANGGSFSSPTSTTDATGQATVTFTTSKVAGTVHTVTATDPASLTGTTGNITTVAGAATKLQVLLAGETAAAGTAAGKTGTPSSVTAGNIVTATVNAVDANWNVVGTATPTVAITSTDASAVLPANAPLVSGTKTFSVTLKTAGSQTITGTDQASSGALTAGTSAAVTVNVGAVSASTSTLAVSSPVAVNGTTPVTVTLRDAYGNVVSNGVAGDFTATASNGSLGTFSCTSGVCTATYAAPSSSGSATINVKVGGSDISGSPATVTISAGAGAKYSVTPAATSVTDGGTTVVTAQLVDASSNAVATSGKVITWSSTNGGSFSSPTSTTDANGQATVTFTVSKVAGTVHTVTATDAGSLTGTSGNIAAVVGAAAKLQVLLPGETAAAGTTTGKTGTPTGVTAGNAMSATVNAVDANWNVVTTATPTVAIASSDANATLPANAALVAGTKSFSVTLKTAASQTITATDQASSGALASNTGAGVTVSAGAVSAATSTLSVSSPVAVSGTTTATVTLKDAYGNVVTSGAATDFAATATSGTLGSFSCTNGVCTASYVAPASSGTATIIAKIGGADISGSPATVTISAGGAAKYIVTPTATSVTDGGTTTITAQLADASNNPVATSGKVITWSGTNGGSFSSSTSTTDNNGQATVTFTVSKVAGTVHTVTATDAGSLTGTSGNITSTVGAFAKLQLLVPGEAAAAGTATGKTGTPSGATAATAFNVTVNAVDANWNVVSSATDNVTLTSTDGSATLPAGTALVSGTRLLSVTLNTLGSQTVTASDATDNTKTANTSPSITVSVGSPSAATSTVSVQSSTLTVGGTTTVTVTVKDAAGNVVTTATSSSITLAASAGTIGTVSCTNGVCTATYTAPASAGTPTISAKIGGANIVSSPVTMTINAAAPTAAKYTVTSSSSSPVAGSGVTITAQLADASGTAISTSGNVVTWSSTNGGSFSSPTSTTDANGQATVTFTTSKVAGTVHTVTGTDASSLTGTTSNITTVVGAAAKLQVLLPGETAAAGTTTGKTGTPTGVTSGNAVTATVNAVDANWNVVTTATPTVAIGSSDGAAVLPANAALVSGTKSFSVTLKTAGSQTITATDQASSGALTSGTSASVTVSAAPPSATNSTLAVGSTSLSGGGTTTVTVTLKDASGATATTAGSSSFTLSADIGTLGTVSCTSGVCASTYTAPASNNTATITAQISGTNISGSPASITVTVAGTPGAPTSPAVSFNQTDTTANSQMANFTWVAPSSNGGSAITDYLVQYQASGASSWTTLSHTASTATSATITGLLNSTTYNFRAAAVNSAGTGAFSATASGTTTGPSIRYECRVNGNSNSSAASASVTPCQGVQVGDIIVIPLSIGNAGSAVTITSNDGFTALPSVQNSLVSHHEFQTTVFYKVATSSDVGRSTPYSFSWSGNVKSVITLVAYKNVDGSAPLIASATGSTATMTAPSAPSVSTNGYTLLYFFTQNQALSSTTPSISEWGLTTGSSGTTDLFKNTTAGSNNTNSLGVLTTDIDKFIAGQTTTTENAVVTGNSSGAAWNAVVLAIHP